MSEDKENYKLTPNSDLTCIYGHRFRFERCSQCQKCPKCSAWRKPGKENQQMSTITITITVEVETDDEDEADKDFRETIGFQEFSSMIESGIGNFSYFQVKKMKIKVKEKKQSVKAQPTKPQGCK